MILTIILTFLLAVSTVSAAENITEDIVGIDATVDVVNNDDQEILNENEDVPGTFDDLSSEISAVEDGGILNLTKDYRFVNGSGNGIIINKSITINGNNHKLDGNNQSRIFLTYDGKITLKDLIFVNGFADKGGAIFVNKAVTCNNVVFENNYAQEGV